MDVRGWSPATVFGLFLSAACSGEPASGADADAGADAAGDDGGLEITPPTAPVLTPCPEGWEEVTDPESGLVTCDPWPDGGPAVLTPCPSGWREVADPETGTVTCDPWPDGGPVVLTPCPSGWREMADPETGTATCDPWPEGGAEDCAAVDEAHFPGEPGCTRIGTACSAGDDWAADLPADREILYVRAGAPPGGAGPHVSPFGTIAEAAAAAGDGTIVALGKGTFDEAVVVPGGVTLWGACVAETVVASSASSEEGATVSAGGADAALRNLRVGGARLGILVQGTGASIGIDGVVVDGARVYGALVTAGGALAARSLAVRNTGGRASDGQRGRAVQAQERARVQVTRGVFERNREAAVSAVHAGTSVTLEDVVVRDTQSRESDRTFGRGLNAQGGASVQVTRGAFERNRETAIFALNAGTSVTLEDVVVRDTQSRESDRIGGRGLDAQEGAAVQVTRGVFERNRDIAVVALNAGTSVTLEDVVVRDTQSQEGDGTSGRGLNVQDGAAVRVTRGVFERNREIAIFALSAGTSVTLEDVVVRDTRSLEGAGTFGRGLDVQNGPAVQVTRGVFERNRDVAVIAAHPGTSVTLADVVVRDTQSQEGDRTRGRGLTVQEGASAELTRGVFERNRDIAVVAFDAGTSVTLEDVVVRDTRSQESDTASGRGLGVHGGAAVQATRGVFERNREGAVVASGAGSSVTLADVVVRDTQSRESDGAFGRGLNVREGAVAEVARGVFERNREAAIFASRAGTSVRLEDVIVLDTHSRESDRTWGRGLHVQTGAAVRVTRVVFERNREVAVAAGLAGTSVTLEDVVVRDTLEAECAVDSCAGLGAGTGVGSYGGGHIDARRFLVTRSALCGVQLAHGVDEGGGRHPQGGTMDLHHGEVSYNTVCGANVQAEGFDIARLMDAVLFRGNPQNLDMAELPVSDPGTPLPEP